MSLLPDEHVASSESALEEANLMEDVLRDALVRKQAQIRDLHAALQRAHDTIASLIEANKLLEQENEDYAFTIRLGNRATVRASRLYQRAHKWDRNHFPGLKPLVEWLLDERKRLQQKVKRLQAQAKPQ